MGTKKKSESKGPSKESKAVPARTTKNPPERIAKPAPKQKPAAADAPTTKRPRAQSGAGEMAWPTPPRDATPPPSKIGEPARALAEAREQIRRLIDDRDNQVAMAEAAEMEREVLEHELAEARERIADLEKQLGEGAPSASPASGEGEEGPLGFEEEEEEEEPSPTEDLDDVESIYDRMDDPRVRRQELDRERIDRESEAGDEPYWRVCPKCGDSLDEVESEDVKIDRCENCGGIYFDHGEVEMLLSIARGRHGLRRIRSALLL